jgi:hypothetical protein
VKAFTPTTGTIDLEGDMLTSLNEAIHESKHAKKKKNKKGASKKHRDEQVNDRSYSQIS